MNVKQTPESTWERGAAGKEFTILDLRVTSMGILAMGEFAAAWFVPSGRLTVAQVAEQYAELAVRMVSRSASPSSRGRRLSPGAPRTRSGGRLV